MKTRRRGVEMWKTRGLCGFSKRRGKVRFLDFPWRVISTALLPFLSALPTILLPRRRGAMLLSSSSELLLTHLSGRLDQDVDAQPGVS